MEFLVSNRYDVERLRMDKPYVVISVTDPGSESLEFSEDKNRLDVLSLQFHDWDDYGKKKIGNRRKYVYFSNNDSEKIINFVERYKDKIEVIVCQCEAGISRSAAIAAALSKCYLGYDYMFFERYLPNSRVYRLILNSYFKD